MSIFSYRFIPIILLSCLTTSCHGKSHPQEEPDAPAPLPEKAISESGDGEVSSDVVDQDASRDRREDESTDQNEGRHFTANINPIAITIETTADDQAVYFRSYPLKHDLDCGKDGSKETDEYSRRWCTFKSSGRYQIKVFIRGNKPLNQLWIWNKGQKASLISIDSFGDDKSDWYMSIALNSANHEAKNAFVALAPTVATFVTLTENATVVVDVLNVANHIASYEVDCDGDGVYEHRYYGTRADCTFEKKGRHRIAFRGEMPHIRFADNEWSSSKDKYYLESLDQWGNNVWQSMYRAFLWCHHFTIKARDAPDLSHVTNMAEMFLSAYNMNSDINHWDVSNITNMQRMFDGASSFDKPLDRWNTSRVTNMQKMFARARKFNRNINTWDVSNVQDMSGMFYKAERFNSPLDKWDVSKVEYMADMFAYSKYRRPLRDWNIASLKDARGMFEFSKDSKYTDCGTRYYFRDPVFEKKVEERMKSIGRPYDLRYNEAQDPFRDRTDDGPTVYDDDDNDYDRL